MEREKGTKEDQNADSIEGGEGGQSVAHPTFCVGYATCEMFIVYPREVWRRLLVGNVHYYLSRGLEKQEHVANPR